MNVGNGDNLGNLAVDDDFVLNALPESELHFSPQLTQKFQALAQELHNPFNVNREALGRFYECLTLARVVISSLRDGPTLNYFALRREFQETFDHCVVALVKLEGYYLHADPQDPEDIEMAWIHFFEASRKAARMEALFFACPARKV